MIQQTADVKVKSGTNYAVADFGRLENFDNYKLLVPSLKREARGKVFIKEFLAFSGMQLSVNKLPAGGAVPFYHAHKENEEAYIFVGGNGQMQIDGDVFDVSEGTIVRVGTPGVRTVRNNSTEPLYFICVQAKENSLNVHTFEDGIRSDDPVTWPE